MFRKLQDLFAIFGKPEFLRKFHGYATWTWVLLIIPSVTIWKSSLLWIIFMSLWANVASHWAAWLAARVEVKTDIAADIADPNTDTSHLE